LPVCRLAPRKQWRAARTRFRWTSRDPAPDRDQRALRPADRPRAANLRGGHRTSSLGQLPGWLRAARKNPTAARVRSTAPTAPHLEDARSPEAAELAPGWL